LVREFADGRSEPAFETLVSRYINLVHSAALRQVGDAHLAQEITQVVFIILARKARSLGPHTILSAWLYRATRYVAADSLKIQRRRQHYEQEAYMRSLVNEPPADTWAQLAPLLDEAMGALGETDRSALVLRFFENKTAREIGLALRMAEPAAQKRVARALEKLRAIFSKRGVTLTAVAIGGALTANSVRAAPAGLATTVTAAVAKGAGAGGSTLTLLKGALKIMAWTKAKMAIAIGAGVVFAAGTTTITVKEIQAHQTYPWQVGNFSTELLEKVRPQVAIVPARVPSFGGTGSANNKTYKMMGRGVSLTDIVFDAYGQSSARTIFLSQTPSDKYDFIANLPAGNREALQREIKRKFGLVGRREIIETNALLLKIQNRSAPGLRVVDISRAGQHEGSSSRSAAGYFSFRNETLSDLSILLEHSFATPVIDQTGSTEHFDVDLKWNQADWQHPNLESLQQALGQQLGLELVPDVEPVEMLVVEKAK